MVLPSDITRWGFELIQFNADDKGARFLTIDESGKKVLDKYQRFNSGLWDIYLFEKHDTLGFPRNVTLFYNKAFVDNWLLSGPKEVYELLMELGYFVKK